MLIRLGYVAISKTLDITSSSTITITNFKKSDDYDKLDRVIVSNLKALIEILKYNVRNNIHFYRLSSNLIPLATYSDICFDYIDKYSNYYNEIGSIIDKSDMRIDMHPGQYCVINSVKKEVVDASIDILIYHYNLLEAMGVKNKILVLHIGGSAFGKDKAISRFINKFKRLPKFLQECIVIENDDKIFNIEDCLRVAGILKIPVVLDYHHHLCNGTGRGIEEYLVSVFATWNNIRPKIHFSSPKNKREFRSHHEYIESNKFIEILLVLKKINVDVDIMLESKGKDDSLFRLVRELKYRTDYKFVDDTSFIV